MRVYSDNTLAYDLRELAEALIDDPKTGPIIQYAAAHGGSIRLWNPDDPEADQYPTHEDRVLESFLECQPVIQRCMAPPRGQSKSANADYAAFENSIVALGAARGLISGHYTSLDDPKLIARVTESAMLCDDDITWGDDRRFAYREGNWNYRHFYSLCYSWISEGTCWEDYNRWKAYVAAHGAHLDEDLYLKIQRAYNMSAYKTKRFSGISATPMFYMISSYVWDNNLKVSKYQETLGDIISFEEFVALIKRERLDFGILYGDDGWKGEL